MYAAEICTDIALGTVMVTEDILLLLQFYLTPHLLDSKLTPTGTFFIFALFASAGFTFIYFYVPETKGLSEKEKKELFMPGAKWGRKLKTEEVRTLSHMVSSLRDLSEEF